jgi:hypothetical protein
MPGPSPVLADRTWARASSICGLAAIVSYGLLVGLPGPKALQVILTFGFGLGLTIASIGLYVSVAAPAAPRLGLVAAVSNTVAAGLLVAMILVQMAIGGSGDAAGPALRAVSLALDVGGDLYVAAGTFLFALAMRRAPGFGPGFAWTGMALAAGLLALNAATFPVPPGDAGLVDLGPAVALWYVAVSIQLARLLRRGGAPARA